jgi:hypothetical protein
VAKYRPNWKLHGAREPAPACESCHPQSPVRSVFQIPSKVGSFYPSTKSFWDGVTAREIGNVSTALHVVIVFDIIPLEISNSEFYRCKCFILLAASHPLLVRLCAAPDKSGGDKTYSSRG